MTVVVIGSGEMRTLQISNRRLAIGVLNRLTSGNGSCSNIGNWKVAIVNALFTQSAPTPHQFQNNTQNSELLRVELPKGSNGRL